MDFLRACIEPRRSSGNLDVVPISEINNILTIEEVGSADVSYDAIDDAIRDAEAQGNDEGKNNIVNEWHTKCPRKYIDNIAVQGLKLQARGVVVVGSVNQR